MAANLPMNVLIQPPLPLLGLNGHNDVCKFIMENIEDKNPKNDVGDTTLHHAQEGYLEIFKCILELVEDKNPSNDNNETPLDWAVKNDRSNIVAYISNIIETKHIKNSDFFVLPTKDGLGLFK